MKWSLTGKRALITGASKGIGLATAEEMIALGAEVAIVARNESDIAGLLKDWNEKGHNAIGIAADIASIPGRERVAGWIEANWGALDILVNNVGTNIRKPFEAYTEEEMRFLFETNLYSAMDMCRRCFPLLCKGVQPAIINVASVAGSVDVGSGAPYGMTKAAEIQLTRHLAVEWAKYGIRVNAVSPWYTRTPLTEGVLGQADRYEKIVERTPLKRVAEAGEMATVIAFLAMPAASYLSGQNIVVDGGTLSGVF